MKLAPRFCGLRVQLLSRGVGGAARWRRLALAISSLLTLTPGGWTQYPPVPMTGPTLGANLRNAANATQTQADIVTKAAYDWGRRAGWATYRPEYFQPDFGNLQWQFQALRQQFNVLASLAQQLGRPRADNAVAELDAGLNIIAELFTFLKGQYAAGTLDHQTIVRTCRAFEDATKQWGRELKKNSSRLGLVY